MSDDLTASYENFPYESRAFVDAHPDRLATLATLFGLRPPPVETARVLEIGCARGDNIVPMGLELPRAQLLGIDLSARQIAAASQLANAVGVTNLDLRVLSVTDLPDDLGPFDYIIAHGVFSWVPPEVQDAILRLCRDRLSPDGVAFLSYNTLPGWHPRLAIREMMLHHNRGITDPTEQVRRARGLIDWLVSSSPDKNTPYARKLSEEAETLRSSEPSYIAHEFLEIYNDPIYHSEFVERAEFHGLHPFADARYRTMAESQPDAIKASLSAICDDSSRLESYHDFLRERTFRRTILCRRDAGASPTARPEAISSLHVLGQVRPSRPRPDLWSSAVEEFRSADGNVRLSSDNPLLKAALKVLSDLLPHSVPFPELHASVLSTLDRPATSPPAPFDRGPEALKAFLLRCYSNSAVDFLTTEPPFTVTPGDRPLSSPLARHQGSSPVLTNLRHHTVNPSAFDRLVLRHLDGTRDRRQIVEALILAVQAGEFVIQRDLQTLTDPAPLRDILGRSLDPSLARLGHFALLISAPEPPTTSPLR